MARIRNKRKTAQQATMTLGDKPTALYIRVSTDKQTHRRAAAKPGNNARKAIATRSTQLTRRCEEVTTPLRERSTASACAC
jgi:hypothetical protein